jgi:hypothetical protein
MPAACATLRRGGRTPSSGFVGVHGLETVPALLSTATRFGNGGFIGKGSQQPEVPEREGPRNPSNIKALGGETRVSRCVPLEIFLASAAFRGAGHGSGAIPPIAGMLCFDS